MTQPPRRIRPTSDQRVKTILTQTHGAQSGHGATSAARPVDPSRRNRDFQAPPPLQSRLAVVTDIPDTTLVDPPVIGSTWVTWTSVQEQSGTVSSGPDGAVLFSVAGVYALTVTLMADGMPYADPSCAIRTWVQVMEPYWTVFGSGLRGGDGIPGGQAPIASASRTFYTPAGGVQVALEWVAFDPAVVTRLRVFLQAQQLA